MMEEIQNLLEDGKSDKEGSSQEEILSTIVLEMKKCISDDIQIPHSFIWKVLHWPGIMANTGVERIMFLPQRIHF